MPPKVKITKKMVADASFEVIRANGHENLNARTISEYLGCSTQPVDTDENPMLALGLNYVRFGQEEKNLFRFLFQTDKFGGKDVAVLMADPGLADIMEIMAAGLKVDIEQAKEMFLTFFCVAHGMASLLANNSMEYDEGQCKKMLENVICCALDCCILHCFRHDKRKLRG